MNKDLLFEIMLELPTIDIISLCRVNHDYLSLCDEGSFWHDKMVRDGIPIIDLEFTLKRYETLSYLTKKASDTLNNDYYFNLYQVPISYFNLQHYTNHVNLTVRKMMNKFIVSINDDIRFVITYNEMLKLYVQYWLYHPSGMFRFEIDSDDDYL